MISRTFGCCGGAASAVAQRSKAIPASALAVVLFGFIFEKSTRTKPVGGVIGPSRDLRIFHSSQAIAVAAVAIDMQLCGNTVLLQTCVEEHSAERRGTVVVGVHQKSRRTVLGDGDARDQAVRLRVVH